MELSRYISILSNRSFFKLWGSQVASKLAENFFNFSLIILIYKLTQSSTFVSVLVILISLPPILLSAFAGTIADSFNRKTILILSNGLRFIIVIIAMIFVSEPYVLLAVAFLLSVVAQFFSPAEVSSIPTLVPKAQLFTANSIYSFTNYAVFLVGYTVAGPILEHYDARITFFIIMSLYLCAASLNSLLPPLADHLKNLKIKTQGFFDWRVLWKRLVEGIKFIITHRVIRFVILQVAIVFSIQRGFISLVPAFAEDFLRIGITDISYFIILPIGLGAFFGAILANKLKHRVSKSLLITTGLFIDGVTLFLLALWPVIQSTLLNNGFNIPTDTFLRIYIFILAFSSGFADPFIIISAQTALHERTPSEDRGRVFGGLFTIINTMGLLPVLVIGLLTDIFGFSTIIAILGIIIILTALRGIFFFRRFSLGTE